MSIIYNDFNVNVARAFKDTLTDLNQTAYFFMAKDSPWPTSTPTTELANVKSAKYINNDIIVAKRAMPNDITLCIIRHNWEYGDVYDQYDTNDHELLIGKPFYVITGEYNVYKCLGNNFGAPSTFEPAGTSIQPFTLPDRYVWKYMYTVTRDYIERFLSEQFIPVREASEVNETDPQWLVHANAKRGAIESHILTNVGKGYTQATVKILGDGTGATAIPLIENGQITSIFVSDRGQDYTWAEVEITGDGIDAFVIPQIAPGAGHGSDMVNELGGHHLMISVDFAIDEANEDAVLNAVPTIFSFRKTGLIINPTLSDGEPVISYIISGCHKIYGTFSNFAAGDTIKFTSGATAWVVDIGTDADGDYILFNELKSEKQIVIGDEFKDAINPAKTGIITKVQLPAIDSQKSYTAYYVDHRDAVSKNPNQIEYVKMVVEF